KGFLPQPIASAIGCHIAITTGESTRLSVAPIRSLPVLERDSALPSLMKAAEAGLAIWACSRPDRMLSIVSPEPIGKARTKIPLPLDVFVPLRLKEAVTSLIHFSFSEPYGKTNSRAPRGATAVSWLLAG